VIPRINNAAPRLVPQLGTAGFQAVKTNNCPAS
jgi:hypothetical protein